MREQTVEIEIRLGALFWNDTLMISTNGRELFRAEGITTPRGRAYTGKPFRVTVPAGQPVLTVEVPTRGLRTVKQIDTSNLAFLEVDLSWTEGKPEEMEPEQLHIMPITREQQRLNPRGHD